MTREEFIEMIDTGGDIMFDCDGRSYTMKPHACRLLSGFTLPLMGAQIK